MYADYGRTEAPGDQDVSLELFCAILEAKSHNLCWFFTYLIDGRELAILSEVGDDIVRNEDRRTDQSDDSSAVTQC